MDRRVQTVIALIENDIRNRPSLKQLARLVHLSPSRLNHIFKQETDVPLAQYVKSVRLRRAKDLLETTFLNVKETMATVGVNDASHFVRDFKKAFGVTPSEYRKRPSSVMSGDSAISQKQPRPTNDNFR